MLFKITPLTSSLNQDPAWLAYCAEMALEEKARSCLLRFRHRLEQDIKPPYLMDHMISDGVLSVDEEEQISTLVSLFFNHTMTVFVCFPNLFIMVFETFSKHFSSS